MARAIILICLVLIVVLLAASVWSFFARPATAPTVTTITPKILTVAMFQYGDPQISNVGEASQWVQKDKLAQKIDVAGLNGPVYCNDAYDHCLVITGAGVMNATATLMALGLSERFDLSKTYIMVAGIAGTPPTMATLGAAAWAEYIVYGGLADGMDPREDGFDWDYQLARLGCTTPWCEPGAIVTGTEVYHLNPTLREWAFRLSKDVPLADDAQAAQYRALFPQETAQREPFVTKCDGLMSDTFWTGARMSAWATWWVQQQTGGKGQYCMAAFEDSGTLTALTRLAGAKRVDLQRVLVLRAASNFDQPHPGQTATEGLRGNLDGASGGSDLAFENLYRAGSAFNSYVAQHWSEWENGVPALAP